MKVTKGSLSIAHSHQLYCEVVSIQCYPVLGSALSATTHYLFIKGIYHRSEVGILSRSIENDSFIFYCSFIYLYHTDKVDRVGIIIEQSIFEIHSAVSVPFYFIE